LNFKLKGSIALKILLGYLIIMLFIIFYSIYFYGLLFSYNHNNEKLNNFHIPLESNINLLSKSNLESRIYITQWINIPTYNPERSKLKDIHNETFPKIKQDIQELFLEFGNEINNSIILETDSLLAVFNEMKNYEQEIMANLKTFGDRDDVMKLMLSNAILDDEVIPRSIRIDFQSDALNFKLHEFAKILEDEMLASFEKLMILIFVLVLIILLITIISMSGTMNSIVKPIKSLEKTLHQISTGIIPDNFSFNISNDEIGRMLNEAKKVINGLKIYATFAGEIGRGNLKADFKPLSDEDELGNTLLLMRENLEQSAKFAIDIGKGRLDGKYTPLGRSDEFGTALIEMRRLIKESYLSAEQHAWLANNVSVLSEIIQKNQNISDLGNSIFSELSKQLNICQGVLYAISTNKNENIASFNLISSYGVSGKKEKQKKFILGEGLVGETAKQQTIKKLSIKRIKKENYLVDFGHFKVLPDNVLLVPLVYNKITYGVIEIVSLAKVLPGEMEYMKIISEKMGIAINKLMSIEENMALLSESQELNEQLKEREKTLSEVNTKISIQNQKVNESINYAERIQKSIIPTEVAIQKILSDFFILYKAKDVISGDFPWFAESKNAVYLAAVDCTGHGVPGALLSFIAYFLLNEIIARDEALCPAEILDLLNQRVRATLKQESNLAWSTDGMDIGLCKIDQKNKILEFSGAHRPLYYVSNGELQVYKGNRFPIGGSLYGEDIEFTNHEIRIKTGDVMCVFSDGFADQFGGEKGLKFGPKKIRDLLTKNHHLSMVKLKAVFEKELADWQGNQKQVDDIIMLGAKF